MRKGRCIFVLAICFILIGIVCNNLTAYADAENSQEYIAVTVKSGDSLWQIVKDNCNDNDKDIRELIYEVKNINNLKSAVIYPGDIIYLPV